ncbi:MAG: hypothetical protein KatS3mg028_1272 [Bacteroidia bacterium]|nr:MAG: hypothetical protein KatS3mg028_1272 [Bacteroidia bacterium]
MKFLYFLFYCNCLFSQNLSYVKEIVHVLSSKEFAGRGYTSLPNSNITGIEKARKFIVKEIKKAGAYDLSEYVKQSKWFTKKINFNKLRYSFDKKHAYIEFSNNNILSSSLKTNGQNLILGKDYLPDASVPSSGFSGILIKYDSAHYVNKDKKIIFQTEKKLMHSASSVQDDFTLIHVHQEVARYWNDSVNCELKITSRVEKINSENIYAFIPGTLHPDSFIVFSAHYDHLGNIDTVYFPGANDNASGVAVLLDLMHYYKTHPHKYSVAFFFFTGEEIGLKGSEYYVQHPLFDLKRIKFLINLDLMGGGSEGIMVVNGKVFQKEYEWLEKINTTQNFNLTIKSRG